MKKLIGIFSLSLMIWTMSCNNPDKANNEEANTESNNSNNATAPLTLDQLVAQADIPQVQADSILKSGKLVMVDFWAPWCQPCKMLKPSVEAISEEMKDKLILLEINVDEHKDLADALRINGIPLLHVYKNNTLVWTNIGLVPKEQIQDAIRKL